MMSQGSAKELIYPKIANKILRFQNSQVFKVFEILYGN